MKDIFKELGITDAEGNPISEDSVNPIIGYRIKNSINGGYIPTIDSKNIMGEDFVHKLFNSYIGLHKQLGFEFNPNDWFFEPVYFSELENIKGYMLMYSDNDIKNMKLFN